MAIECNYAVSRKLMYSFLGLLAFFLVSTRAPAEPFAYITNRSADSVSVIDTATNLVIATIPVAGGPSGVVITPGGTRAYVTLSTSGKVAVIDTGSRSVIQTIPVGTNPDELAITPDGTRVYVANSGSGNISVINTAAGLVGSVISMNAAAIKISSTGFAYVASKSSNTISVLDTNNQNTLISTITLTASPGYLAVSSFGTRLAVSMPAPGQGGSASMVDTGINGVLANFALQKPLGLALGIDATRLYVVTDLGNVQIINTTTKAVTSSVNVSSGAEEIALTPDGKRAYVPAAKAKAVSVIDTASAKLIATIPVGSGAHGVAITPATPLVSWNPATSCTPVVVTLRQILGTQQNANGGALQQGGYPYLIPDKTALSPPCVVSGGSTFVQINNLLVTKSQVIYADGDYTFNVVDDNDPNPNIYMKTIHVEDSGEWQAAGIDAPLTITPGMATTLVAGERIDMQGFVYWDPNHIDAAWHSFSGWEIHPLSAWRINPASPPVSSLPAVSVVLTFDKTGAITTIQNNVVTYKSDHCCPVRNRIESTGSDRGLNCFGSRMRRRPVKWAFFRKA